MFDYKQLLIAMDDICWRMPDEIYLKEWGRLASKNKYLPALFADAFKSVELFCEGMKIVAITQCGMILRLLIEQTAIIKCLCSEQELSADYVHHYDFRKSINGLSKSKQITAIKEEFGFEQESPTLLQFLDYGWLGNEAMRARNKEDYLIERAGYSDCLAWKKMFLDKFAHQSFTFADVADKEKGSTLVEPFMQIACKMFDELCCLYHSRTSFNFEWDGESKFQSVFRPIYKSFVAYLDGE